MTFVIVDGKVQFNHVNNNLKNPSEMKVLINLKVNIKDILNLTVLV